MIAPVHIKFNMYLNLPDFLFVLKTSRKTVSLLSFLLKFAFLLSKRKQPLYFYNITPVVVTLIYFISKTYLNVSRFVNYLYVNIIQRINGLI